MRRSWGGGVLAVAALLVLAPPGAAAPPVRGADYVGSFNGRGNISFTVSRDGKRIYGLIAYDAPAQCHNAPRDVVFSAGGEALVGRNGRFGRFSLGGSTVRGAFVTGGLARGRADWIDGRSGCSVSGLEFTARARRRPRGLSGRVFDFAGQGFIYDRHGPPDDGVPATAADTLLNAVDDLPDGSLLMADTEAIRRIDRNGRLHTLLDEGVDHPADVVALPGGGYLFTLTYRNCVQRVDAAGALSTVAGQCAAGTEAVEGDGGPATAARMAWPRGLSLMPDGSFLVSDGNVGSEGPRVRRVAPDGTITTVAGNGLTGFTGDGGPATAASFSWVNDVEALPGGGFLVAEGHGGRVRRVGSDGLISTIAGTGFQGFSGDGGPATSARLYPIGVASLRGGAFLVSDSNGRLRRVSADGTIQTVAGAGEVETGVAAGNSARVGGGDLTVLPNGSIVSGNFLIASPAERRLLVGFPARPITYLRAIRRRGAIPLTVTRRSRAVVVLRDGPRVLLRTTRTLPAGRSVVRFRARGRPRYSDNYYLVVQVTARKAIATALMSISPWWISPRS